MFRIVADSRGSMKLRQMWEDSSKNVMEVPAETDETMLITMFMMRVSSAVNLSICFVAEIQWLGGGTTSSV